MQPSREELIKSFKGEAKLDFGRTLTRSSCPPNKIATARRFLLVQRGSAQCSHTMMQNNVVVHSVKPRLTTVPTDTEAECTHTVFNWRSKNKAEEDFGAEWRTTAWEWEWRWQRLETQAMGAAGQGSRQSYAETDEHSCEAGVLGSQTASAGVSTLVPSAASETSLPLFHLCLPLMLQGNFTSGQSEEPILWGIANKRRNWVHISIQVWWDSFCSTEGKCGFDFGTEVKTFLSDFCLSFFAACLDDGAPNSTLVTYAWVVAGMNASKETPYPQELLGNSTWADSSYHQNYTLSPPLLPGKIKPAACEQLHIAVEVWAAMGTNNGQAHICSTTGFHVTSACTQGSAGN